MTDYYCLNQSSMIDNVWITVHKGNSKMGGKTSIMMDHTEHCEKRSKIKNTVCHRCYSRKLAAYRRKSSMRRYMEHNSGVLRSRLLTEITLLKTPDGTLRYNSTGDNYTEVEVINIFHHANKNKHLKCASWTKNYGLYYRVMKNLKAPKNLNLIWSMTVLNSKKFIIPKGFTKSFYVYTSHDEMTQAMNEAKKQGYNTFKCELSCSKCNRCYMNKSNEIIFELIR